jgi:hypothetical protein
MQHQRITVGVVEERHVADACVERLACELDAFALELRPRRADIWDAQRDVVRVRCERETDLSRIPHREAELTGPALEASGGDVTVEA